MKPKAELYAGTYKNYAADLYKAIRAETFGEDIGQNSWLTANELRNYCSQLKLSPGKKVLEMATGSGGPAVLMAKETGCHLTGIDISDNGVNNAKKLASENKLGDQVSFLQANGEAPLPFPGERFDVLICIDAINHLKGRDDVLRECNRVLKKGGQLLYTDPIIVTGILTNEEIEIRSSIGFFLFVPLGENERLLKEAGFRSIQVTDVTGNMASVSAKWYHAREKRKRDLLKFEDENNFNGLQSFLKMVHLLSSEKRLSRLLFTAIK